MPNLDEMPREALLQNIDLNEVQYRKDEQVFKNPLPAYVDRIILTSNNEDSCLIKMITR